MHHAMSVLLHQGFVPLHRVVQLYMLLQEQVPKIWLAKKIGDEDEVS